MLELNFFVKKKLVLRGLGFNFEYFPHPFYPILIPNTSYVEYPKIISGIDCKMIFLIKGKNLHYFCTGCPKSAAKGVH